MKPYSDLAKIIHREGYIFIIIFAVITFVLGSFSTTFGWIGTISTLWCAYFFRNLATLTLIPTNACVSTKILSVHDESCLCRIRHHNNTVVCDEKYSLVCGVQSD